MVELGIAQRRRLRVARMAALSDVGVAQDVEAFGVGGHHPVFDAVVHHLHEMAGAVRAAVQEALLGRGGGAAAPGRSRRAADAGRERREDRLQVPDDIGFAADHEAVAAVLSGDAAARPHVDVVVTESAQLPCASDVVAVVRVAPVDHDVGAVQVRHQLGEHLVDDTGRHHHPDRPRRGHFRHQLRERCRADGTFLLHAGNHRRPRVVDNAFVPLRHQAAHHARAHSTQADHSELHLASPSSVRAIEDAPVGSRCTAPVRYPPRSSG